MKEYCLEKLFVVYYFKVFPHIKYVTQNKGELSEFCFKNFLKLLNDKESCIKEFSKCSLYIALTHDVVIRRLEKVLNVKVIKIRIPFVVRNINGLKKYLVGEKTRCGRCDKSAKCKSLNNLGKHISSDVKGYLVFFIIK